MFRSRKSGKGSTVFGSDQEQLSEAISDRDHLRGSRDAPVALLEYGDFECPFCGKAFPVINRLREALGEDMVFVYRHFPISMKHEHALPAAEAAEAAGAQGKFWEYHDLLFVHQDALEDKDLVWYAKDLSLDVPRFERDLAGHAFRAKVDGDFRGGIDSGVPGTPTFFIDGRVYLGPPEYRELFDALVKRLRGKQPG